MLQFVAVKRSNILATSTALYRFCVSNHIIYGYRHPKHCGFRRYVEKPMHAHSLLLRFCSHRWRYFYIYGLSGFMVPSQFDIRVHLILYAIDCSSDIIRNRILILKTNCLFPSWIYDTAAFTSAFALHILLRLLFSFPDFLPSLPPFPCLIPASLSQQSVACRLATAAVYAHICTRLNRIPSHCVYIYWGHWNRG